MPGILLYWQSGCVLLNRKPGSSHSWSRPVSCIFWAVIECTQWKYWICGSFN